MAFTAGVATDLSDFIAQLVSFAVTHAGFVSETSPHTTLSKGGVYFHMDETPAGLLTNMSTTFAGEAFGGTPGSSQQDRMSNYGLLGPYVGHYFFTDGVVVYAALELATNVFNHVWFGSLEKQGAWVGGEFVAAGNYSRVVSGLYDGINSSHHSAPMTGGLTQNTIYRSVLRCESLGSNIWHPFGLLQNGNRAEGCTIDGPIEPLLQDSPNRATGRTVLFPQYVFLLESVQNLYHPVGHVAGVRILEMDNLNPKDLTNTDWQVFPVCEKNGDRVNAPNSLTRAFAYRRV